MAKKKFLNLDNMNILWDNIDRNFLRREDIPYTEFEELETDSNTIIGAINELYKLISGGINPVYPSISCSKSSITENYQSITKTVTATYKDFVKINDPQVTGGSWLTVTQTGSDDSRTYSIKLAENNGATRTGSIVLSCTGRNGNAQHTISVKQNGIGDATITLERFPSKLSNHEAFTASAYYATYSGWETIDKPTSNVAWMTISEVTGGVDRCEYKLSVTENTGAERQGTLTFSCVGKNGNTIKKTHTITQPEAGAASITFNPNPIEVNYDANEATVYVTYENYKEILAPTEALAWVDSIDYVSNSGDVYTYRVSGITKNASPTSRNGNLTFKCTNLLGQTISANVQIKQKNAPAGQLTVTPTSKTVSADGGEITFTVSFGNSEYYWVTKDNTATWVSIPAGDEITGGSTSTTYKVTVAPNTGSTSRSTHLVFHCHGYDGEDTSVKVTITQDAKAVTPTNDPLYYGYIPYTTAAEKNAGFTRINEDIVNTQLSAGTLKKVNSGVMGKTDFGAIPRKSLAFVAIPINSGLTAKLDDGFGVKCPFEVDPCSNGENTTTINGITYGLYGQNIASDYPADSLFFYVD